MADYIYPVNDQSDSWGGPPVKDYFRTATKGERWYLATCYNMIEAGDRIWAYATTPLQQIVGVGYVVDGPYLREWPDGSIDYRFDIEWDVPRNKELVNVGPAKLFDRRSAPRTVRRAKPELVKTLQRAYVKAGR